MRCTACHYEAYDEGGLCLVCDLRAECARWRARAEAAEKDSERLTWLENSSRDLMRHDKLTDPKGEYKEWCVIPRNAEPWEEADTVREAIDAARAALAQEQGPG